MAVEQLLLLIVACLALLALLLGLWALKLVASLRRELNALRAEAVNKPAAEQSETVNFSTSLDKVEREQLQAAAAVAPRNSAEKYRYVASLADQGLDAQGIAAALQMPAAEVEQLLRLAKLKPALPAQ